MKLMKVAMIIANEMLVSHSDEIKYLSKEALRHEIKLIVDKEWASSDHEQLVADVEQEIHENLEKEEKSELNRIMAGTYVTKSSSPQPKIDDEWIQEIVDLAKKATIEKMSKSMYPQEYKIRGRRYYPGPIKLRNPYPLYSITYDWNLPDDKSGSEA